MSNRLWVLGAPDVEMAAIERLLVTVGERIAYATVGGVRVHPGNAYKAAMMPIDPDITDIYYVECDIPAFIAGYTFHCCDHHRPGDPGYGRPPEDYYAASSIGQVIALLGRPVTADDTGITMDELLMIAAADHCLEPAYRGRCPGVDPDALMRWRAETRAAFQGRTVEEVLADVWAARKKLRMAAPECIDVDQFGAESPNGRPFVADLRGQSIPELPEAAAREGIPFLATVTDRDGRVKVVLQAAGPELIRKFLAGEIVAGLTGYYGDPARGFAGGYQ